VTDDDRLITSVIPYATFARANDDIITTPTEDVNGQNTSLHL